MTEHQKKDINLLNLIFGNIINITNGDYEYSVYINNCDTARKLLKNMIPTVMMLF